jgi:predicted ATPase
VWLEGRLEGLRVVGPFRAPPERHYEYRGATPPTSDTAGRDIVNALIESSTTRGETRGVLLRGVNRWLEKVARVKLAPLKPMDKAKKLFKVELRDTESGRFANFADVGFGIGQALPVIVEGLRTPMLGTFIVQEPEIHLHPDAQLAMADFLIELARSGRQVIVETHSEHILLRIRRRLLADQGLSADDVSLIHIGKDASPGGKAVPLKLDDLGQIENWPSGFLQEANSERMALLEEMAAKVEASGDE